MLIGALVVVIALVSYQQLAPSSGAGSAQQAAPTGTVSIAVLPFANMSGDAGQEFFSDGMTEEINAALANVKSLRVIRAPRPSSSRDRTATFAPSVRRWGQRI